MYSVDSYCRGFAECFCLPRVSAATLCSCDVLHSYASLFLAFVCEDVSFGQLAVLSSPAAEAIQLTSESWYCHQASLLDDET